MYSKWRRPYRGSSDEAHLFLYSRFIKRPPWLLLYLIKRGGRRDAGEGLLSRDIGTDIHKN